MSKYFSVLFFVFLTTFLYAVNACPSCPEGEEHSTCGTSCQRSCGNMNDEFDCADVCVKGCFCEQGLVREDDNKDAKCIPPSECHQSPSCSEGEEYSTCGTACELSCKNMNDDFGCPGVCVEGCFCEQGLVRVDDNKGAKCIPPSECHQSPSCSEGEEYSTCGTLCQRSCGNMNDKFDCEDVCVEGCFCEQGLVREDDNKDAKCIPPSECHQYSSCSEAEEYSTCGTACELSCENMNDDFGCPGVCVEGCFCEQGLVREDDNKGAKCIPPSECRQSPSCSEGEEYSTCGTACELSCENMNDDFVCADVCVKGCFCEQGLVREDDNKDAKCIPPSECRQSPSCSEGEEYSTCGTACELSCENMNDDFVCADVCVKGCFCEQGLVREDDNKDAKCIPPTECLQVLKNQNDSA